MFILNHLAKAVLKILYVIWDYFIKEEICNKADIESRVGAGGREIEFTISKLNLWTVRSWVYFPLWFSIFFIQQMRISFIIRNEIAGLLGGSVHWASDFSSGYNLTVCGFGHCIRLSAVRVETALDPLSPSVYWPLPCLCSLSKINKH